MKLNEAQFTVRFKKWITHPDNKPSTSEAYELKSVKGGTFNINTWTSKQGHQAMELDASSSSEGTYHKLSDESRDRKPYDAFYIVNSPSFLVIYFQKHDVFFKIPFEKVKKYLNKTSISYEELMKIETPHRLLSDKKEPVLYDI